MNARSEIDILVAVKVMGLTVVYPYRNCLGGMRSDEPWYQTAATQSGLLEVPNYSTDMAAAWTVMEKISKTWGHWGIIFVDDKGYEIYEIPYELGDFPPDAEAPTLPLAICRAALKAVVTRGNRHQAASESQLDTPY